MRPNDLDGQKETLELRVDAPEERYGDQFGPYHTVGFKGRWWQAKNRSSGLAQHGHLQQRKKQSQSANDERGCE